MKPAGPRENHCIWEGYTSRTEVPHFDDTPNEDQWQGGVYLAAQQLALKHGLTSVLDMGCGSGFKLRKYFAHMARTGVEVEPTLSWLRRTYPEDRWLSPDDLGDRPLGAEIVVCADVVEHVQDPDLLIQAILAQQPLWVVISTPDSYILSNETGPPHNQHHVREWNADQFCAWLRQWFAIVEHRSTDPFTQTAICCPLRKSLAELKADQHQIMDMLQNVVPGQRPSWEEGLRRELARITAMITAMQG